MYGHYRHQPADLQQRLISSWYDNIRACSPRQCGEDSDGDETVCGNDFDYPMDEELYVEVLNSAAIEGCGKGKCNCLEPRPPCVWKPRPACCGCTNHEPRATLSVVPSRPAQAVDSFHLVRGEWSRLEMTHSLTNQMRDKPRASTSCDCCRNSSNMANHTMPCNTDAGYPPLIAYKGAPKDDRNLFKEKPPSSQWRRTGDGKWTIPQRDKFVPPSPCQSYRKDTVMCMDPITIALVTAPIHRPNGELSVPQRPCLSPGKLTVSGAQIPYREGYPCYPQGQCNVIPTINFQLAARPACKQTKNKDVTDICNLNRPSAQRWSRYSASFKSLPNSPAKQIHQQRPPARKSNKYFEGMDEKVSSANYGYSTRKKKDSDFDSSIAGKGFYGDRNSRSSRRNKSFNHLLDTSAGDKSSLKKSFKGDAEKNTDQNTSKKSLRHIPLASSSTLISSIGHNPEELTINTKEHALDTNLTDDASYVLNRKDKPHFIKSSEGNSRTSGAQPQRDSTARETSTKLSSSNSSISFSRSAGVIPMEKPLDGQSYAHRAVTSGIEANGHLKNDRPTRNSRHSIYSKSGMFWNGGQASSKTNEYLDQGETDGSKTRVSVNGAEFTSGSQASKRLHEDEISDLTHNIQSTASKGDWWSRSCRLSHESQSKTADNQQNVNENGSMTSIVSQSSMSYSSSSTTSGSSSGKTIQTYSIARSSNERHTSLKNVSSDDREHSSLRTLERIKPDIVQKSNYIYEKNRKRKRHLGHDHLRKGKYRKVRLLERQSPRSSHNRSVSDQGKISTLSITVTISSSDSSSTSFLNSSYRSLSSSDSSATSEPPTPHVGVVDEAVHGVGLTKWTRPIVGTSVVSERPAETDHNTRIPYIFALSFLVLAFAVFIGCAAYFKLFNCVQLFPKCHGKKYCVFFNGGNAK